MKRTWVKVICVTLMMALLGAGAAWGATKDPVTRHYVFTSAETAYPVFFGKQAQVEAAYDACMAGLKAKTAVASKAASDAMAKVHMYRTILLYSIVGTPVGYGVELGNARAVAYVAADNWAVANGQPAPFGSASLAEWQSISLTLANFPEGPAFTLISGPFYCFSRQLDIMTGAGINRSLLVNAAVFAAKVVIFQQTAITDYAFFRIVPNFFHNALAWSAITTIPANMLVNAGYGLSGKGISYCDLVGYQESRRSTVDFTKKYGTDFGRQYRAMSAFGQLVL